MRAIAIRQPGAPEQLCMLEVPEPTPGEAELLIGVHAIGVNRADCLQRRGLYPPPAGVSALPGLEVAGEVLSAGPACSRFAAGDRVYALLAGGGYAERVSVAESVALPMPARWTYGHLH